MAVASSSSTQRVTGEGATATIDGNGNYTFVGPLHGFSPLWTNITVVCNCIN